jgi:hydrogenase-4 component F
MPALAVLLMLGILLSFGALLLRLHDIIFGEPKGPTGPVQASYVPLFLHLALVFLMGFWLPDPLVRWFRSVAVLLG